ncbi:thioesterase II family protein [Streptomyces sp. NK08204]|uniref:thioesterase II family protein n=1 Tax=Streptomyces sp. NK08204 TaxID=2873260 RepID=UPI001CED7173|nr:thioesterase domain-containing protein [Streptomyces sp. NK08204]
MELAGGDARRWFRRLRRDGGDGDGGRGDAVRLLCFHHAGGSAAAFRQWPQLLPSYVEPVAVQLPGRMERFAEPAYVDMGSLVDDLVDAVQPFLQEPYAFYGASMGGRVSWALAHALRERGMPLPRMLFISHSPAPGVMREIRGWDGPDEGLVRYMRELGGTPPEVFTHPAVLKGILRTLRADLTVLSNHAVRPAVPLDLPIRAFAGADDPMAAPELMSPWAEETTAEFRLDVVGGGHFPDSSVLRLMTGEIAGEIGALLR